MLLRIFTILLISVATVYLISWAVLFLMRKNVATLLTPEAFKRDMRFVQVIDIREYDEFKRAHILGARNMPYSQFKHEKNSLRKDQPVYLYDGTVGVMGMFRVTKVARMLNKDGHRAVFILKDGFEAWDGKVKRAKS